MDIKKVLKIAILGVTIPLFTFFFYLFAMHEQNAAIAENAASQVITGSQTAGIDAGGQTSTITTSDKQKTTSTQAS